ncbi:MAG: hypothetical protein VKJ64_12690 [Leptolyngbyaceae bacterium]|nr:hypothetical protein [Leptolyngbyaceae bacterium]
MMTQRLSIVAIAMFTSVATVSVTYRLLSQSWCLQPQANGQAHRVYQKGRCDTPRISSEPPHHLPSFN